MTRAYFNWSGGKDSAMALWRILADKKIKVDYLLTNVNHFHNRVSMHGVRRELLEAQAFSLQIPLATIELPEEPDMMEYETAMMDKVTWLRQRGITTSIFGDIFLEDLKNYRVEKLAAAGIECAFPIWQQSTHDLAREFIDAGFKAIVVCVNEQFLDKSFCGRIFNHSLLNDLPDNVDDCGENGEFHTFVFEGPIFNHPIRFTTGEIVYKEYKAPGNTSSNSTPGRNCGFYFCDLVCSKSGDLRQQFDLQSS